MRPSQCLAFIVLVTLGCAPEGVETDRSLDPRAVATFDGTVLTLEELEERLPEQHTPACQQMRRSEGGGGIEELVPCYREIAEALALERLIVAEIGDLDGEIARLTAEDVELQRHALLDAHARRLWEEVGEPEEGEMRAYYEAHREDFRRHGRVTLWNLFRRHEDPGRPGDTLELLRELKARAEAGENFGDLAREYSHSETRLRDGLVGQVGEGQLPPRLETIALGLGEGEVSDPIPVAGGAVLLLARGVVRGEDPPFEDLRPTIRQRIEAERLQELVTASRAGLEPPPGSVILDPGELVQALDGADDHPVLVIADERVEVARMRHIAGLRAGDRAGDLPVDRRQALAEAYERLVDRQLLYLSLLRSDDPLDAELRERADRHVRGEALARIVDAELRAQVESHVTTASESVRAYFDDNRAIFQTPVRFQLSLWDVPFDDDPPRQMRRMLELRASLVAGELDLDTAVDELGGTVTRLDWRSLDDLPRELPMKARSLILQTEPGGFTDVFQQDDALHLVWVRGREEPRPLELDEAADEVREAYMIRFGQQLFDEEVRRRLENAGFTFHEDTLRRLLSVEENG